MPLGGKLCGARLQFADAVALCLHLALGAAALPANFCMSLCLSCGFCRVPSPHLFALNRCRLPSLVFPPSVLLSGFGPLTARWYTSICSSALLALGLRLSTVATLPCHLHRPLACAEGFVVMSSLSSGAR